jgi:hypothetical protein
MSCRFDELKNVCTAKGLTNTLPYIESLRFKIVIARYYAGLARECEQETERAGFTIAEGQPDPEWLRRQYITEAHTLSAAQMIHSTADYMGQVIDRCVLDIMGQSQGENRVTALKVKAKLAGIASCANVHTAFSFFLQSDEFKYIAALVNTIKHQRLIDIHYDIFASVTGEYQEGVRFNEFQRGDEHYERTYTVTIYDIYMNCIVTHLCEVVDELIAFLQ